MLGRPHKAGFPMTASSSALQGCHVLVVEDDYMIAQCTAEILLEAGAKVLGPIPSLDGALCLVEAESRIDCAVLDVNLNGEMSWPLVDVLLRRGVSVLLATGYSVNAIPQAYVQLPYCEKPVSSKNLTRTIVRLLPGIRTPQEVASWRLPSK